MSGQVTAAIGLLEITLNSQEGLLIERYSRMTVGESSVWMSLQEARELLGFLQDNLEPEPEHARSTLRPFLDGPAKGGIDR